MKLLTIEQYRGLQRVFYYLFGVCIGLVVAIMVVAG